MRAAGAQKSSKDTLTIVFQANQGTLNPHFAATNQEMLVIRNIYNGLLKYKPDSVEIAGDLATSWDVSADGLSYTFKLRPDVEWQKGFGHFTANDVKGSFDRLRAPETSSRPGSVWASAGIRGEWLSDRSCVSGSGPPIAQEFPVG